MHIIKLSLILAHQVTPKRQGKAVTIRPYQSALTFTTTHYLHPFKLHDGFFGSDNMQRSSTSLLCILAIKSTKKFDNPKGQGCKNKS